MADTKAVNIPRLIAVPSVITLAVTILRVVGELKHWPSPLFNTAAGGGGAIVGIAWLPIIFGPYFAVKLMGADEGPASTGRAIGYPFLGLVVFVLGGILFQRSVNHPSAMTGVAFLVMLCAAFVPVIGWRSLGRTMLDYGLAARIPVIVVMYFAMSANGGAGWGTHYDAVPPPFANLPWTTKYIFLAVVPQLTLWIAWTTILGGIFGGIAAAVVNRGKHTAPASA
jgi:hypothetical protein